MKKSNLLFVSILVAVLIGMIIVVSIGISVIGKDYSVSINNGIEIIKTLSLLIIAIYTFYFIDVQRQRLSQEKFEFEIYKTFYSDAAENDGNKKIYVLENITLYRKNFILPDSQLDNSLVALAEVILKDYDVKRIMAAPDKDYLVEEITGDRSSLISGTIVTKEEVFGPIKPLSDSEYKNWQEEKLAIAALPFEIPLAWDTQGRIRRLRVHKKAIGFFVKVFKEIENHGLKGEIHSFGGTFWPRGRESMNAHAYGIAIDLNPDTNRLGTRGTMNASLVGIFKQNGFAWGGDWKTPDPQHFELMASAVD